MRASDRLARPARVLLVEDNRGDARLTEEILLEGRVAKTVTLAEDGDAALTLLRRAVEPGDKARPDLVILDLNLPRRDGREVLAEVKGDSRLSSIPVIVLTTSRAEADVERAYDLHANCYVVKPLDLDDYAAAVRAIEDFWLSTARLPRDTRP